MTVRHCNASFAEIKAEIARAFPVKVKTEDHVARWYTDDQKETLTGILRQYDLSTVELAFSDVLYLFSKDKNADMLRRPIFWGRIKDLVAKLPAGSQEQREIKDTVVRLADYNTYEHFGERHGEVFSELFTTMKESFPKDIA